MCKLNRTFIFLPAHNRQRRINKTTTQLHPGVFYGHAMFSNKVVDSSFRFTCSTSTLYCTVLYIYMFDMMSTAYYYIRRVPLSTRKCGKWNSFSGVYICGYFWLNCFTYTYRQLNILYFPATNHIKLKLLTYAFILHSYNFGIYPSFVRC